jgi:hypothetical protein
VDDLRRISPYAFSVKNVGLALAMAALVLAASFQNLTAADDGKTVGRVRVTTLHDARDLPGQRVGTALAARFAPVAGKRFADRRVISVRPRSETRTASTPLSTTTPSDGVRARARRRRAISRKVRRQPARMLGELGDACAGSREQPSRRRSRRARHVLRADAAISLDADGRRLVNVG